MDELPIVKRLSIGADLLRSEYGLYGHARDQEQAAALIREQNSALLSAEAFVADFVGMRDAPGAGDILGQVTAALAKAREG